MKSFWGITICKISIRPQAMRRWPLDDHIFLCATTCAPRGEARVCADRSHILGGTFADVSARRKHSPSGWNRCRRAAWKYYRRGFLLSSSTNVRSIKDAERSTSVEIPASTRLRAFVCALPAPPKPQASVHIGSRLTAASELLIEQPRLLGHGNPPEF